MTWLLLVTLLAISLACAYYGTTLLVWTAAMAGGIVVFAATGSVPFISLAIVAAIFALIAIPLNVVPWRQQFISGPFLKQFRRMLPEISETEQAALDAGTVGWEGELFAGRPDWSILKKQPYLSLTVEEQSFLDGPVEELCEMLDTWEITHVDADLNPETWAFLKKHRFFGMIIPKEYGGLGFSALAHRAVLQKIASVCGVTASTVAVPNSLGPGELLLEYGTEEQKNHYLPRLARGEDERDVTPRRPARSISHEVTFDVSLTDPGKLLAELQAQADRVGARLRAAGLSARTVTVKIRDDRFHTVTRSRSMVAPSSSTRSPSRRTAPCFINRIPSALLDARPDSLSALAIGMPSGACSTHSRMSFGRAPLWKRSMKFCLACAASDGE